LRALRGVMFFSSRRRHTRFDCDWSSDVCSSDLIAAASPSPAASVPAAPDLATLQQSWPTQSGADFIKSALQAIRNPGADKTVTRSEERRVGKECRSRWSPYH